MWNSSACPQSSMRMRPQVRHTENEVRPQRRLSVRHWAFSWRRLAARCDFPNDPGQLLVLSSQVTVITLSLPVFLAYGYRKEARPLGEAGLLTTHRILRRTKTCLHQQQVDIKRKGFVDFGDWVENHVIILMASNGVLESGGGALSNAAVDAVVTAAAQADVGARRVFG